MSTFNELIKAYGEPFVAELRENFADDAETDEAAGRIIADMINHDLVGYFDNRETAGRALLKKSRPKLYAMLCQGEEMFFDYVAYYEAARDTCVYVVETDDRPGLWVFLVGDGR